MRLLLKLARQAPLALKASRARPALLDLQARKAYKASRVTKA